MSTFVLDTDIISLFQKGQAVVCTNVAAHLHQNLAIAVISVEEQLTGWYSYIRKTKQRDKLAWGYDRLTENIACLSSFRVLTYNLPPMLRYETLRKLKLNIGSNDLRIAAIVLEIGATLVTRNARDFKQVPGLVLVDWSQ